MINVKYPFHFFLNWNPAYSYCELPLGYEGDLPAHWEKLLEAIPASVPKTKVSDITIENVTAWNEPEYDGISRAFHMEGFEDQPIEHVVFKNVSLACREFGVINHTKDIEFQNVTVSVSGAVSYTHLDVYKRQGIHTA